MERKRGQTERPKEIKRESERRKRIGTETKIRGGSRRGKMGRMLGGISDCVLGI